MLIHHDALRMRYEGSPAIGVSLLFHWKLSCPTPISIYQIFTSRVQTAGDRADRHEIQQACI